MISAIVNATIGAILLTFIVRPFGRRTRTELVACSMKVRLTRGHEPRVASSNRVSVTV
jgi:hypothetical protein